MTWDDLMDARLLRERETGASWPDIAQTLGTTAESARHRYQRLFAVRPGQAGGTTAMGSVLSDVQAEFTVQTNQCQTCVWLVSRSKAEQAEWDAVMADKILPHRAIWRAMRKRGFDRGDGTVSGHRNSMHRQAAA